MLPALAIRVLASTERKARGFSTSIGDWWCGVNPGIRKTGGPITEQQPQKPTEKGFLAGSVVKMQETRV